MAITATERTQIVELTVLMFNAAPGADYLSQIVAIYEGNGRNLQTLANILAGTWVYTSLNRNFQTAEDFADAFLTPLGLETDAFAVDFVVSRFNAGVSKGDIAFQAYQALNGVVATDLPQYLAAQAILTNKTEVAEYYSVDKAVAETDLNTLQLVLSNVTDDDQSVTDNKAAIDNGSLGVDGLDITLTPQQDSVVGSTGSDKVAGLFGDATISNNTYTTGDSIDLGAGLGDQLNLVALGTTASPAITVKNVETINISDTVGAVFNALLVENAPAINFTNTQAGLNSTVTSAALASVMGLSGKGNLVVDYANTTGTADTANVALNDVGTSATVRSFVNVSDANTVEAVSIATSGTNFAVLIAGTAAKTVTVTGSGTNNVNIGPIAATATIDASASTGTNTFNLGGTLSNGDVVKGGTGADTVSFNATTAIGGVTFTGVETLKADIDVDASLSLAGSTGIKTLTLDGGAGSATITNATSELATVNITSQADADNDLTLGYATGNTGTLAVNVGSSASTAGNITMDGLTFTRLGSFTLNGVGTKTLTLGDVDVDGATAITVAAGTSLLSVGNVDSTADDVALNVSIGASGSAYVQSVSADSFADVNLTVAAGGIGDLSDVYASAGGFGNITATAGSGGSAYIDAYTNSSEADTDIGDVSLTLASGATGSVYAYAYSGDAGAVSLDVGANTSGYMYVSAGSFSAADGSYLGGGNVGNVNVNVNGTSGSAYLYVSANDWMSGDGGMIGDVNVTVAGDSASADVNLYASGGAGSIGNVNIAVAANGIAYVSGGAYEDRTDTDAGNVGNLNITAGDGAYVSAYFDASGSVGTTTLTGDDNVSAYVTAYGYSGDVGAVDVTLSSGAYFSGWFSAGSGTAGPATISVGEDSYVDIGLEGGAGVGAISVAAGAGSTVYAYAYGETGNVGAITITGGAEGDYAYAYASGGSVDAVNLSAWLGSGDVEVSSVTQGTVITAAADGGTINATAGADVITGGAGADTINGNGGADVINAGGGVDTVNGGAGADAIDGGAGNDALNGDADADVIVGGAGTDAINGGAGTDTINGGAGKDTMMGGTEADTFVFTGDNLVAAAAIASFTAETDIVADFVSATDKFDFTTAGTATNYAESAVVEASLAALLTSADTALNGTVQYYLGVFGTDGYLVYSADGANAQAVVKLTGVTDIAYTDIV